MGQKFNVRFESKISDIGDVFNKIEEELSNLYESSMIRISDKPAESDENRKTETSYKKNFFRNIWVTFLNLF